MARVLYGGVGLQGLSGSINKQAGGHTFTKNNIVRRRVVPTNPQTDEQMEVRAAFSFLTTAWTQELTDSQRSAWESAWSSDAYYQKQDPLTGVSRKYGSAKDLFIAMNTNFLISDGSLSSPVVTFLVPGPSTGVDTIAVTSVVADASDGTVVITYTGTLSLETLSFKATNPVSAGNMRTTSVRSKFRLVSSPLGASPVGAGAAYTARFGAITGAAGQKIFWTIEAINGANGKARLVNSGVSIIQA